VPFIKLMVRSILDSAAVGIADASNRFDRAAAQVTTSAAASENAATVQISAAARGPAPAQDGDPGTLEGAIVDTRVAKYAFIANLRTLQTGQEMSDELNKLGQQR
jgi:hypothetical protein